MTYGTVQCERVEPMIPEAYVCRWEDRNVLVLELLGDGKGCRISERAGIPKAPGLLAKRHALITVESYSK